MPAKGWIMAQNPSSIRMAPICLMSDVRHREPREGLEIVVSFMLCTLRFVMDATFYEKILNFDRVACAMVMLHGQFERSWFSLHANFKLKTWICRVSGS